MNFLKHKHSFRHSHSKESSQEGSIHGEGDSIGGGPMEGRSSEMVQRLPPRTEQ